MPSILRRGRALVVRGRKLVLRTAGCLDACCEGGECSQFVRLIPCTYGLPGPCNPQRPEVYACAATTLCVDGTPAFDGNVNLWRVDGWCYTRMSALVPRAELPDGANILLPKHRLVCVGLSDCEDDRCPRGGSYYRAEPCPGVADEVPSDLPPIYVCVGGASPGCNVYDFGIGVGICYVIRTGSQVFDGNTLPPNAIRIDEPIGPGARTCCECLSGCDRVTLAESECLRIQAGSTPTCCCSRDDQYQVTVYSFVYDYVRIGDQVTGRLVFSDLASENSGGIFRVRETSPFGTNDIDRPVPTNCGFNFSSMLQFFPAVGVTLGTPECLSFTDDQGNRVQVTGYVWTHRCDYVSFALNYDWYADFGNGEVLNARVSMRMAIRRIPDPNHRCAGGCGGNPLFVLTTPIEGGGGGGVVDAPPGPPPPSPFPPGDFRNLILTGS